MGLLADFFGSPSHLLRFLSFRSLNLGMGKAGLSHKQSVRRLEVLSDWSVGSTRG